MDEILIYAKKRHVFRGRFIPFEQRSLKFRAIRCV